MKRTLLTVLALLWASSAAVAEPLRIGYVYAMANAPLLVAEAKGYFRDEGLEVALTSFTDGPLIQQALAARQLDVAYVGTVPVYHWYARGLNSVIIAKVNGGQAAVLVPRDSRIETPAQLAGHRIAGVRKGSGMDVLLRGYVLGEAAGLQADRDVQIVDMPPGNMNAALERGRVDAAFSWEPFVSQAVLRGQARVLLDVNQALPDYPWYVVIALPSVLSDRREDTVRLLRAHLRAIAFLNEQPEEADRILAEAFRLEPVTRPDGSIASPAQIVATARERMSWSARLEQRDLDFIQRLMNYSLELKFMSAPLDVERLVNTSFLDAASR